jgi:hypothetical protein
MSFTLGSPDRLYDKWKLSELLGGQGLDDREHAIREPSIFSTGGPCTSMAPAMVKVLGAHHLPVA